ncbi:right-handed parallel beta-helix repeat-containing protein [Streptomyces sp. SM13]|uniref:right-handed parallel beta-helix repeat-containing protein n=1 Tax=Streptomyces sp. SM13 TaxID=1983803 RepID=UPI0021562488|nr:right-handed parallel beta-helix repeat-containing protein [Streptomyces sp. SM13]
MERVGNQLLVRPGATGTIWDAAAGGTQITDLTDLAGTPITAATADSDGAVAFFGPDDVTHLYMDFGYGRRYAAAAVDLGQILQTHLAQRDQPGGWPSLDSGGRISPNQVSGALDWRTVTAHGAVGDGVADDTPAIFAAVAACPVGGVVYFPAGVYRITETLDLPMGITLQGTHSNMMVGPGMTDDDFACWIQPSADFTGTAVLQIIGDDDGTHPDISGEQRLRNLMIDGSQLTGSSIDGIFAKGNVQNVVLDDFCIRQMPNNGIVTADRTDGVFPYSWRLRHVMIDNCHANGVLFNGNTDITLDDVQVIGSWGRGFVLENCTNAQLLACRAEWNGSHGYHLTGNWGDWQGSGGMQVTGCSTDRNGGHGMLVDATGNTPILITGLQTRRDGRNGGTGGGGYAALAITAATVPVVATGIICYPGVDDGGTSTNSPDYGISVTGSNTHVQVDDAYLHAAEAGLYSSTTGTLITGPNITQATGPTDAPVRTASAATAAKGLVVAAPTGAATYVVWRAPKDCTVTAVRGYRVGGTGVTINATADGADLLAADLSLSTPDTWMAGPGVQNAALAAGDSLAVAVRSVTGAPTAVTIQVDIQGA